MKLETQPKNKLVHTVRLVLRAFAWGALALWVTLIGIGAYGVTHRLLSPEVFERALGIWTAYASVFCLLGFWPRRRLPAQSQPNQ